MKKCIVFGTTYFSEMLQYYLEKYYEIKVVGYTVDKEYFEKSILGGKRVVPFDNVEDIFDPSEHSIMIGIGYNKMNNLRKLKMNEAKRKGFAIQSFIHPSSTFENVSLGEGNIVFENVTMSYGVKVGDGNIFWNGCNISHHTEIGDYNFFAPSSVLAGKVKVKNNCFVGINASIRGNRVLEDYTLIGAGCHMNVNSELYGVYVPERSKKLSNKISTDFM